MFSGEIKAALYNISGYTLGIEGRDKQIHCLLYIKFLAGKDVNEDIVLLGEGMDADVALCNHDKSRNSPILRHLALAIGHHIWRHYLCHANFTGKLVQYAIHIGMVSKFLPITLGSVYS